jgi:hypothetical protein
MKLGFKKPKKLMADNPWILKASFKEKFCKRIE